MAGTLQVDGCATAFSGGRARSLFKKNMVGWAVLFNCLKVDSGVITEADSCEYGVIFTVGNL